MGVLGGYFIRDWFWKVRNIVWIVLGSFVRFLKRWGSGLGNVRWIKWSCIKDRVGSFSNCS